MIHSTTSLSSRYLTLCTEMLLQATKQRRTALRLVLLTIGLVLVPGRAMVSRVLMVMGLGDRDWTAAYRVFTTPRFDITALQRLVVAQWLTISAQTGPMVAVVDGTQLPRTGRKMPGAGWLRSPRTPVWYPGIHHAQRWEGVSGLTDLTEAGDSRTIPLWFAPAPTPRARPWPEHAPCPEWQAALDGIHWVRSTMDEAGAADHPLVIVGDGAYTGVAMWNGMPEHTVLIARCAKNRALYRLPSAQPSGRGRRRVYGDRGLSPQAQVQDRPLRRRVTICIRGKERHLRLGVSGPWLLKKAPTRPMMLVTIGGIDRGPALRRRSRDVMHFLVTAQEVVPGQWQLPYTVDEIAKWVWQRWEVEVMHRELKSGWGLGDQQQWSPIAAATVTQWVVWAYAVLILIATTQPSQPRSSPRWYRGRRWTPRDLTFTIRQELWTMDLPPLTGIAMRFATKPPKITALATLLAVLDAI